MSREKAKNKDREEGGRWVGGSSGGVSESRNGRVQRVQTTHATCVLLAGDVDGFSFARRAALAPARPATEVGLFTVCIRFFMFGASLLCALFCRTGRVKFGKLKIVLAVAKKRIIDRKVPPNALRRPRRVARVLVGGTDFPNWLVELERQLVGRVLASPACGRKLCSPKGLVLLCCSGTINQGEVFARFAPSINPVDTN